MPETQTGHIFSPCGKNRCLHWTESRLEIKHVEKQSQFTGILGALHLIMMVKKKSHPLNFSLGSWRLAAKLTQRALGSETCCCGVALAAARSSRAPVKASSIFFIKWKESVPSLWRPASSASALSSSQYSTYSLNLKLLPALLKYKRGMRYCEGISQVFHKFIRLADVLLFTMSKGWPTLADPFFLHDYSITCWNTW